HKIESPLEPGHIYIWQIAAKVKDGNDVYGRWPNRIRTHAEFRVLATDELKLVQDAEKNYQPDKDPIAYLALAARYAKAGLVEDAEQMLNAYLKERPTSPQVVKMLNSLKRQSGGK
ncbi:MAG: tetratricopeptide repeat protein, partial [Acidobacteriota bacterium]